MAMKSRAVSGFVRKALKAASCGTGVDFFIRHFSQFRKDQLTTLAGLMQASTSHPARGIYTSLPGSGPCNLKYYGYGFLPSGIKEQQKIAADLSVADAETATLEKKTCRRMRRRR